jgi:hypothetical protein
MMVPAHTTVYPWIPDYTIDHPGVHIHTISIQWVSSHTIVYPWIPTCTMYHSLTLVTPLSNQGYRDTPLSTQVLSLTIVYPWVHCYTIGDLRVPIPLFTWEEVTQHHSPPMVHRHTIV